MGKTSISTLVKVKVKVKVIQKINSSRMIELTTIVTNQRLEVVISGIAKVTWVKYLE